MPDINVMKMDPSYRSLSPAAQMYVTRKLYERDFKSDPDFMGLSPAAQRYVLDQKMFGGVTFNDAETERRVTSFAGQYLQGEEGLRKQAQEFFANAALSSGIIGFVDQYVLGGKARIDDRKRAVSFYKELDRLSGSTSR